ncbi:MAG TPA: cytochrome c biogenesis protein ResB [Anaeromyxobacter sp.]|nr:cytochrome c biogenesis protein ResB [Anaeromyxobacter sp.]
MNVPSSAPAATTAAAPPTPALSVAEREVRLTSLLIVAALLLGLVLQVWVPPGGVTLVAGAALAGAVVIALWFVVPGRLRETLAGFRFIATLLFVLATFAMLGTLVLQMKPAAFYIDRYGLVGRFIVGLRLDDVFHGLPFALVMALFGASVIGSASLRWPLSWRKSGFFICHVGLMTSLAGAAASATLAIRGRIDLHAGGETAKYVRVTRGGAPTGEYAQLGFDLRLDRFKAESYETEYRVGYYEQVPFRDEDGRVRSRWNLKASFDPDADKHRLPNGDSFQLRSIDPAAHAVLAEVHQGGIPKVQLLSAERASPFFLSPSRVLVYERRADEKRAYISWVTATAAASEQKGVISVNEPMTYGGWTLYQVNYNPEDPTYSGLEAVYDPGVSWVFLGFFLICLGVAWMFYVEPRLKRKAAAPAAPTPAAA